MLTRIANGGKSFQPAPARKAASFKRGRQRRAGVSPAGCGGFQPPHLRARFQPPGCRSLFQPPVCCDSFQPPHLRASSEHPSPVRSFLCLGFSGRMPVRGRAGVPPAGSRGFQPRTFPKFFIRLQTSGRMPEQPAGWKPALRRLPPSPRRKHFIQSPFPHNPAALSGAKRFESLKRTLP